MEHSSVAPRERHRLRAPRIKAPLWVRWPVIAVSLLPAAWIAFALWSDLTRNTRYLGANPVKEMEHYLGVELTPFRGRFPFGEEV